MSKKEKKEKKSYSGEVCTLEDVMNAQNEICGPGTMFRGSGMRRDPPRIPTGVFAVDFATAGGLPLWGTTCFWGGDGGGKSNLCLNVIKAAQSICWRCMKPFKFCTCDEPLEMFTYYADVEGTLDRDWASAIGADPERYVAGLADYGEQHVNIADEALKAADCGLVIIDSLAALIPTSEMDAPLEDKFIAEQARLITRMVRKLKQRLIRERKKGHLCAVLFTNQLRVKIGEMFGNPECLHGDTLVNFVDGRSVSIREVVQKRLRGPVWTYNELTGEIEPKTIKSHHINGVAKDGDFLTLYAEGVETPNGVVSFTGTYSHWCFTNKGWLQLKDIRPGDLILANGTLCEDSHLSTPMQYKLPRGFVAGGSLELGCTPYTVKEWTVVTDVVGASSQKYKDRRLYDIHVEGNNNYFVGNTANGVLVHNTMPGGYGLRHEFSLLLRCVQKALKKKGSDAKFWDASRSKKTGQRFSFSIKKEKVLTLSGVGEYVRVLEDLPDVGLKAGMVDDFATVLKYAKDFGIVVKEKGKWVFRGKYKASRLEEIRRLWMDDWDEYLWTQQEIIARAKERVKGGKGSV